MPYAQIARKALAEDNSGITITFTDGTTLPAALTEFSPEIIQRLALHGLSQKLGDSYSGESDLPVAIAKATSTKDHLVAGNWAATRTGTGGGPISDLARALANLTQQTIENCVSKVEALEPTAKKNLRNHPKIKVELQRIKLERAEASAAKEEGGEIDF